MKRNPTLRAALALLLAAGALSCSKDPIPEPAAPETPEIPETPEEPSGQYVSFVAGTPEAEPDASAAPASRAGYDSATGHAVWDAGDRIGIFVQDDDKNKNLPFTQKAGTLSADRRKVEYEGTLVNPLSGTQTVYALYPYDSETQFYSATLIKTTFPGRQLYSPDGYTGIPLYGKYEGDIADLQFKNFINPFALIELRLSSDEPVRVTRIVFQGNNDEQVSGPIDVDLSGALPAVTPGYDASKSIVLDCGEGVALSTAPTSFYIAIPVQEYAKGYRFDIRTDNSGANGIVLNAKSGGVTPAANTIVVTPTRTLAAAELKKIIPDKAFRTWLAQNGWVTVDDDASGAVTVLDTTTETMNCSYQTIASLEGIEYFPQLTTLDCTGNRLSALDISANTLLTTLSCSSNQLTSLDMKANTLLTKLNCNQNQLTTLDVSANTSLSTLDCSYNQLSTLNVSANTSLSTLACAGNQLTTLDVSANTLLISLNCYYNQHLTTLDLTANTLLSTLNCSYNVLSSLTLPQSASLSTLNCAHNLLTALDGSTHTALTTLDCSYNQLTSLTLPATASLTELECSSNQLTELDVSLFTQLKKISCGYNLLTTLDISQNTKLADLSCYKNRLTTLDATTMADPTGYSLYCGNQKDAAGQNVTLQLTLKETHRTRWESSLASWSSNSGSVTATFVP